MNRSQAENQDADYGPSGEPFGWPEWSPGAEPPRNAPISHTMDQNVDVTVVVWTLPASYPATNFHITGTSSEAGFNFDAEATFNGTPDVINLTSTDKIAKKIDKLTHSIQWTFRRDGFVCHQATSGPHTVYVTMGTPRDWGWPEHKVTQKRMERAIEQASAANSLNPHEIVKTVTHAQGNFALVFELGNAWEVPDGPAPCASIVRFVEKVIKMVNVPGTFERRHIYAIETDPDNAIEVSHTHGGLNTDIRIHPNGQWQLFLIDHNNGCNSFEAVAKFTACGMTRYYPGGVVGAYTDNKDDVLKVFQSLSWIEFVDDVCTVREQVFMYPGLPANPLMPLCP